MQIEEIEQEIIVEKKTISNLFKFVITVIVIAILGTVFAYYNTKQHYIRFGEDSSVFDVRIQNLDNSVTLHEKRLDKLEEKLSQIKQPVAVQATPVDNKENEKIAELEKEISTIKTNSNSETNEKIAKSIKLLSSFHRLSERVVSGRSFVAELAKFQENFNDKSVDEAIAELSPYADNGVPTNSRLTDSFDDALEQLKIKQSTPPENAGFWERLKFNIYKLISVHKIDKNQTGNSVDAIVGRALDHLEQDEIEAAIAEIKSLPDNERAVFTAWLEDAQIASAMPALIDQIEEQVMQKSFAK